MPRVKAKPFTSPIASRYRIAAARKLTASAERIVRRARTQARGTADAQRPALADLVLEAFEVDDERVGRDTDRHDEPGDAGEAQGEADLPAQQHQAGVDDARPRAPRLAIITRPSSR